MFFDEGCDDGYDRQISFDLALVFKQYIKFLNLFPETEFGNEGGGGIHIHIEDSVLNALLEKVPWTEVFESLNNKLSRTEETKHIREHIYKVVSQC